MTLVFAAIAVWLGLANAGSGISWSHLDRYEVKVVVRGTGSVQAFKKSAGTNCDHTGPAAGTCTFVFLWDDLSPVHQDVVLCGFPPCGYDVYWANLRATPPSSSVKVTWDSDLCRPRSTASALDCQIPVDFFETAQLQQPESSPRVLKFGPIALGFNQQRARVRAKLRVRILGVGHVRSLDGSVLCGPQTVRGGLCTELLTVGKTVVLEAIAAKGWKFTGWTGCTASRTRCKLTVPGLVQAQFTRYR